jgi:hypothetical protein
MKKEEKTPELTPPSPVEQAVDRATERFVQECIHNSPLSGHTESYNHLMAQLPRLRQLIIEEMGL